MILHFLEQLDEALKERRIGEGVRLLEQAGSDWTSPDIERGGAAIALRAAQWLDVGHRDRKSMELLLARFTPTMRARMPFHDYLELRLAEAFHALMTEDADTAIEMLEFVLKADRELGMKTSSYWRTFGREEPIARRANTRRLSTTWLKRGAEPKRCARKSWLP